MMLDPSPFKRSGKAKLSLQTAVIILFMIAFCCFTGCRKSTAEQAEDVVTDMTAESAPDDQTTAQIDPDDANDVSDKAEVYDQETKEDAYDTVSIIMVGDILLHDPVEAAAKREDGSFDFDEIFANTSDLISSADLALVNQEVIIGGEELGVSGYPAFNAPYEIGDALYDAGFDVVLHATNHALDRGAAGLDNCLSYWEEEHPDMVVLGICEDDANRDAAYIREINGIRIAILNYTYGTNGISLPEDRPYAVNIMDDAHHDMIAEDLRYARDNADFVIVCPHWGIEYELTESPKQREWASFFADNGADLIIGTHPHVIEPIEMIEDEAEGDETLCYYSLGNFVNWTGDSGAGIADRMVGGMAQVELKRNADGDVDISDYSVKALVCHLTDGQDGVTVYPLSKYNEKLSFDNRIRSQDPAFNYDYCVDLCNEVWSDKWE